MYTGLRKPIERHRIYTTATKTLPFILFAIVMFAAAMSRQSRTLVRKVAPFGRKVCSFQTGPVAPQMSSNLLQPRVIMDKGRIDVPQEHLMKYPRFRSLIGETPLVDLTNLAKPKHPDTRILAKCEFMNPSNSIKDRIVYTILTEAEKQGLLKPGMTVVAASSGNTGASTAMIASMMGYKSIVITSPKCSQEKMDAIRAYGAELLVTAGGLKTDDPKHYMNMETTICEADPDRHFGINQYENALNPLAHYMTLGPEIWGQTDGRITHFIAAGSTGGTLSGTARYLKEVSNGDVRVIMADPVGSVFYEYFKTGILNDPGNVHVEGVGKENIPGAMDFDLIDDAVRVTDKEAFKMCHTMAKAEGILAGGSGGLNVFAATRLAEELEYPSTIVTVLPDSGIKYLSKIYNKEWLQKIIGFDCDEEGWDALV